MESIDHRDGGSVEGGAVSQADSADPATVKYDHSISLDVDKVDQMVSELATAGLSDADFLRHVAGHFADHHGDRLRAIAARLSAWEPIETAPMRAYLACFNEKLLKLSPAASDEVAGIH